MGWLFLALFCLGAMAVLALLGLARPLWTMLGAALMLGAAGYALQGRPTLAASPARPVAEGGEAIDPDYVALRDQMFGRFTAASAYLTASDAIARSGDDTAAARLLLGGIGAMPRSAALWTELGTTIARRDGDTVSTPALFAFRQAAHLAPGHSAPFFFLGLAYIRGGELLKARGAWAKALALAPPTAPFRPMLAERLELFDQLIAMEAARANARRR